MRNFVPLYSVSAYRNVSYIKKFVRIYNGRIQIVPLYCTQDRKRIVQDAKDRKEKYESQGI